MLPLMQQTIQQHGTESRHPLRPELLTLAWDVRPSHLRIHTEEQSGQGLHQYHLYPRQYHRDPWVPAGSFFYWRRQGQQESLPGFGLLRVSCRVVFGFSECLHYRCLFGLYLTPHAMSIPPGTCWPLPTFRGSSQLQWLTTMHNYLTRHTENNVLTVHWKSQSGVTEAAR